MKRNPVLTLWIILSLWLTSCIDREETPAAEDKTIASLLIRHTTPKLVKDSRLSHLISSQPGTIYNEGRLDNDIRILLESRCVEDVKFIAEPDGDSVHLVASVSTTSGFGPTLFVGNSTFSDARLWNQISAPLATRVSQATTVVYDLETDDPIVHRDDRLVDYVLPTVCDELERFYRSQGFPNATVRIKYWDSGTKNADDFDFVVDENSGDE